LFSAWTKRDKARGSEIFKTGNKTGHGPGPCIKGRLEVGGSVLKEMKFPKFAKSDPLDETHESLSLDVNKRDTLDSFESGASPSTPVCQTHSPGNFASGKAQWVDNSMSKIMSVAGNVQALLQRQRKNEEGTHSHEELMAIESEREILDLYSPSSPARTLRNKF
ncbi:MAG: hypothetical protein SGCHY_004395, partial [Lobulomycetales sp.]